MLHVRSAPTPSVVRAGLHNHSTCSDGRLSPAALVDAAERAGYEAFAITDHNSIEGWRALGTLPDWVIPGIELSALADDGTELHILGLGVRARGPLVEHSRAFQAIYDEIWAEGLAAVDADGRAGTPAPVLDPVQRETTLNRLGERAMSSAALRAWESIHARYHRDKLRPLMPSWRDAVAWLRGADARVGLAHPHRYRRVPEIADVIASVDAVEVVHPSHNAEHRAYWFDLAQRLGKASWASHDFHGWSPAQRAAFDTPLAIDPRLSGLF